MLRLLLISPHFPPAASAGVFRLAGFCRQLPACGWEVQVVAAPAAPGEPLDNTLAHSLAPGVTVWRAAYPAGRLTRLLQGAARRSWLDTEI